MDARSDGLVKVKTLLGSSSKTAPLKNGELRSPLFEFAFADIDVAQNEFKPFVRELKFDMGELAIATFLQAKAAGKPLVLMPFVMSGMFHHSSVAYNAEKGDIQPQDLPGRRVGVRSYTQTTGVWVRGFLQNDYGVDLSRVRWLTFEEPHVVEYRDPPSVEREAPGKNLGQMLLNSEVDAALIGPREMPKDARLKTLIPDPAAAAQEWRRKHQAVPINHMIAVTSELSRTRPDVVEEIFRLLCEASRAANADFSMTPIGVEPNRNSLEIVIEYCVQQGLIPTRFSVDELFDDTTRKLGR